MIFIIIGNICYKYCVDKQKSKEKSRITNIEKYGVDNPAKSEFIKEKIKQTNYERYGGVSPMSSVSIQDKVKKTCLDRYGCENIFSSEYIKEKIKQTNIEKYGVEYSTQSKDIKNKIFITHKHNYYDKFLYMLSKKDILCITSKEDYLVSDTFTFQCKKCNHTWKSSFTNPREIWCPKHTSHYSKVSSRGEKDIVQYIQSIIDTDIQENIKTVINGLELDIYIPDKKVAIEYNGYYWHSDIFVDKNYHLRKTEECKKQGIRLIHIFEYEWDTKKDICKSIIASALGVYERKIYARKCVVKEISSTIYKEFLDINHIQGSVNSSIRYGLYYNDELVSVIGYGKSRFKSNEFELQRYCSLLNTQIIGGFSKLIYHSKIHNFISYVDLAHFDGKGYDCCGFKVISQTKPSYVYIKQNKILSRYQTQKHKLQNILAHYDSTKTEYENMMAHGYHRVYDCGNIKVLFCM